VFLPSEIKSQRFVSIVSIFRSSHKTRFVPSAVVRQSLVQLFLGFQNTSTDSAIQMAYTVSKIN